ncbi:MAG: glycosylase [Acidobacteria bacterium]|nr:glycosylase [Acidobacteriota bacterium]MCA1640404.1 glycosylase [Acidobacteriota bacterium]
MGNEFRWEKRGLVFAPDGRYEWMQSHAQNPSVLILEDRLRVYFTCRPRKDGDGNFAAVTTFVDLEKRDPGKVIYVHDRPILPLGGHGAFDQFGVMPGCALLAGSEVWLYYVGWMRCQGAPYTHAIGMAKSDDGGFTFRRLGVGPLFGRTLKEPFLQNSPVVFRQGDTYHMWYSSGVEWLEQQDGHLESIYVLMHATSGDGVNWQRDGVPCVPTRVEYECQTNPSAMRIGERFYMWFCYRCGLDFRNSERGYRIGLAWSDDLTNWHRDDSLGELKPSAHGWDSEMVCYPCVVNVEGETYMFYSGNYFGRDGFGYAALAS